MAAQVAKTSQVGALVSDRSGRMCHYCHPAGAKDIVENMDDWDLVEMYAHRCSICAVRNIAVGDRAPFVERLHKRLFVRAQHVVAPNRKENKGQLSNVMLTHSALSEFTDIHEDSRYAVYIQRCLRAELKVFSCLSLIKKSEGSMRSWKWLVRRFFEGGGLRNH